MCVFPEGWFNIITLTHLNGELSGMTLQATGRPSLMSFVAWHVACSHAWKPYNYRLRGKYWQIVCVHWVNDIVNMLTVIVDAWHSFIHSFMHMCCYCDHNAPTTTGITGLPEGTFVMSNGSKRWTSVWSAVKHMGFVMHRIAMQGNVSQNMIGTKGWICLQRLRLPSNHPWRERTGLNCWPRNTFKDF